MELGRLDRVSAPFLELVSFRMGSEQSRFSPVSESGSEEQVGTLWVESVYKVLDRLVFSDPSLVCIPVLASQTYVPAMESGTDSLQAQAVGPAFYLWGPAFYLWGPASDLGHGSNSYVLGFLESLLYVCVG